jgi:hypothetical protein
MAGGVLVLRPPDLLHYYVVGLVDIVELDQHGKVVWAGIARIRFVGHVGRILMKCD